MDKFGLFFLTYGETNGLHKLKTWVDARIAEGNNDLKLNISWGYYDDIDDLNLEAK
jgi:hypothetical protein